MNTALAIRPNGGGHIVRPRQIDWAAQREIVKNNFARGAKEHELDYFFEVCKTIDANPVMKEAYLVVSEYTNRNGQTVRSSYVQVGIDWLRRKALQSGNVAAIYGPELAGPDAVFHACLPDGVPVYAARAGIKLKSLENVHWFVAYWDEFGSDRGTWKSKPRHMLCKVAMSHALKFGVIDVSGVYTAEEMAATEEFGEAIQVVQDDAPPRQVPRPARYANEETTSETDTVDESVEDEATETDDEPERRAFIEDIRQLLLSVYPDQQHESGVDWQALKVDILPQKWRGRWGNKYPQLKDWSLAQLSAFADFLRDAKLTPSTDSIDQEPDTVVNPADFGSEDDA